MSEDSTPTTQDTLKRIPSHVAIIMDGNGRWAEARGLSRSEGHSAGAEPVRNVLKAAHRLGIKHLTLYTFSTENWYRSTKEVNNLFSLLVKYLDSETEELLRSGVRLNAVGDLERLPETALKILKTSISATSQNVGITLTLALSYGSRAEIIHACQALAQQAKTSLLNPSDISEEIFVKALWTRELPDVDLLIRTGGDKRISNFLLWQLAYAELYFTETLWPDFGETDLIQAIHDFESRDRRFGRAT
ncbi:MAG: isoprenyl transferase [Deltaproteobacteria bacterium]|nr:isoprenyl transferase [Deltaproteobacteria bacterium]